jgi:hypothetical protein
MIVDRSALIAILRDGLISNGERCPDANLPFEPSMRSPYGPLAITILNAQR